MHPSAQRVAEALKERGVESPIIEFSQSTRTAQEAAAAVGASVGQIVKSLVFLADGRPLLALVSGANRADPAKIARLVGAQQVERADADTVRAITGFAIGGVPPVGHMQPLPVYLDRDLQQYALVYAAAGTPHAVFAISPQQLQEITDAAVVDLAEEPRA
ncbi:MAG: YbaK/EbsC family protein [Chloroflexia bacterium]